MTIMAFFSPIIIIALISLILRRFDKTGVLSFLSALMIGSIIAIVIFISFFPAHQAGTFIIVPFGISIFFSSIVSLYILKR